MNEELFEFCKIKEREFEHKKKLDMAYYYKNLGSMITDKIIYICLELLKLRMKQTYPKKSWQNIINLKRAY